MNKKIIKERVSSSVPSTPSDQPADPTNPVTKMLFECKLSQNQGDASADVDAMVTTAHVKLDAKNQQVRQVAKGEEDQNVIVLSQLEGYLQKGSRSIAGLFLPTSGGPMVGDINMGTSPGNTIKGLPSSWGSAMFLGNEYAASVGIVQDVVGEHGARLDDLIERITKYSGSGEGSMTKLLEDLGSPKESQSGQTPSVTLEKPTDAKWLLLSAKNAMTGTLRFEKKQGALPTTPDPTITNLKARGLGTIGTATPTDKLQNIVSVADLTTILKDLQENAPSEGTGSDTGSDVGSGSGSGTDSGSGGVAGVSVSAATTSTFPEWTGQEVPYLVEQSPDSGSGSPSVQNPLKSSNADNYIKKDNGTYSLLRRGLYLITFAYEFSSPTQNGAVTCTGTLRKTTTPESGDVGAQPTSGDATAPTDPEPSPAFSVVGSSDGKTVVGSAYILVPGDKALSEHTLTLALTTNENTEVNPTSVTDPASKSYVAISYMGAGY
ncbi:hypothetical protein FTN73_01745 [Chlamydia trachomatis]|uniref:Uncharacterized protein n=1 Tax=Chlamydia trachomatis TaxID=813 RepID=A1BLN4_CHLTH|nr:hypothetical protein [Chlamydia trachomatis]AAZ14897.1 hypothetical protein CT049 [Chlamydia trachomatis]AAZ14898.1 hypothetical protein CT049 [Chlamydia trachomatis]AAZ20328.1 hypothetical protein CT049 [Chlamydia trachomatis]AAZ39903.1 hypothetical protein CT049 [Chlamydia trachomatis]AAZ39909.1 hypothetical protein CT049 [Chlamydia trachomatis]